MSNNYRAEQVVCISGWECGTEIELMMVVNFTVYPGSKATQIDPAEEPTAEVDSVRFFDGKDELTLPWSISDRFTNADGFQSWLLSEAAEQHQAAVEDAAEARAEEMRLERRS
ncbi:hypothetical protein A6U86_05680 [Rhizobium sp. AC27/96]|uniref:hypothetical protein n=1 Tax=Rhizobium sp. AC27/96 TaxID=1841653 RepID=UPI00082743D7|nr:hypothetical protein [Rhizobium sp. AC27/96]OCJ12513.1 hypothetical protein A6U86_05680 [Rhizobium sp. AC27/96]